MDARPIRTEFTRIGIVSGYVRTGPKAKDENRNAGGPPRSILTEPERQLHQTYSAQRPGFLQEIRIIEITWQPQEIICEDSLLTEVFLS